MLERMPKSDGSIDFVARAAPDTLSLERSGRFQVGENLKDRAFGDPDEFGNIANPRFGLARNRNEHVRMVTQKRPGGTSCGLDGRHVPCYQLHENLFM